VGVRSTSRRSIRRLCLRGGWHFLPELRPRDRNRRYRIAHCIHLWDSPSSPWSPLKQPPTLDLLSFPLRAQETERMRCSCSYRRHVEVVEASGNYPVIDELHRHLGRSHSQDMPYDDCSTGDEKASAATNSSFPQPARLQKYRKAHDGISLLIDDGRNLVSCAQYRHSPAS
jgi:hypothetical protein